MLPLSPFVCTPHRHRRFAHKVPFETLVKRFAVTQKGLVNQLRKLDKRFYACVNFEMLGRDNATGARMDSLLTSDADSRFSFQRAVDDIIDPDQVKAYDPPSKEQYEFLRATFDSGFEALNELCLRNTKYGQFTAIERTMHSFEAPLTTARTVGTNT